jgi:hypothetical protein
MVSSQTKKNFSFPVTSALTLPVGFSFSEIVFGSILCVRSKDRADEFGHVSAAFLLLILREIAENFLQFRLDIHGHRREQQLVLRAFGDHHFLISSCLTNGSVPSLIKTLAILIVPLATELHITHAGMQGRMNPPGFVADGPFSED